MAARSLGRFGRLSAGRMVTRRLAYFTRRFSWFDPISPDDLR